MAVGSLQVDIYKAAYFNFGCQHISFLKFAEMIRRTLGYLKLTQGLFPNQTVDSQ